MHNFMKRFFENDKVFLICVLLKCVNCFFGYATDFIDGGFLYMLGQRHINLVETLCVIWLYVSYRKHSKNVMKGLMGALLMGQLIAAMNILSALDLSNVTGFNYDVVHSFVYTLLTIALFINHFLINSDHHSSPRKIMANQLIVIALSLTVSSWNLLAFKDNAVEGAMQKAALIIDIFGYISVVLSIVCIESRLDAYRLNREASGWTEEGGYPRGYIHEYEKRK